ncbi:MAG: 50S ribosomal protein L29 [Cyclobacteriaceae bacterium]|nr:50S ribosomal protein L29 [Cyclobacteriaceae bacterium]
MKNGDIKALTLAELNEKIGSESEALRKLKFAHQVSAIENPMRIKETRRLIARLKTELKAKETQK